MSYELNQADIFGFANSVSGETLQKGDELFFKACPYCEGGKSHDKQTFSINLENGAYSCFRSSCGKKGHFVELARDFNYALDFGDLVKPRVYKKLPQAKITVRGSAVDYLKARGISEEITKRYKITSHKNDDNILVFPFFNENSELVFIKYRNMKYQKGQSTGSKEWCEKDSMPILFGMQECVDFDRLVITEGQLDSLSLSCCGIKNAVSVPTGANGFTFLDNVWDWLIKFHEVVVFGDFEHGKITLLDALQKRLPMPVKAVQTSAYLGEKDANAILTKYGGQALINAVNNAKIVPVNHVKELADVEAIDIYSLPRVFSGIAELDSIIGGLYFGQVILLTGKRGDGKSTFMSQLMLEAIEQDYPVFAYSGELADYHFKRWLDLQAAGRDNLIEHTNKQGEKSYRIADDIINKINGWYRGRAYIYDNNSVDDEAESLLQTIEAAVCRYGIKLVCVDNIMTALDVGINDDIYRAQSKFVKALKSIAVKHNIAVILVAHPRKSSATLQNDDVSGSSDITNRVDVVMSYARCEDGSCDSRLSIIKNRLTGKLTKKGEGIELFYSEASKRISSISGTARQYGWKKVDVDMDMYMDMENGWEDVSGQEELPFSGS